MKEKFWRAAWAGGVYGWGIFAMVQLLGIAIKDDGYDPSLLFFLGWVILPFVWMLCSGFGLNDHFAYELGYREHVTPEGYRKVDDTTPAKRIILQWLAPIALCYFVIRKRIRKS